MAVAQRNEDEFTVKELCRLLGISRSSWYRSRTPKEPDRRRPPRKLSDAERAGVLSLLNSEKFQDEAVPSVHAKLLDEGKYLCSQRTMYRILKAEKQVRQRRHEREHPVYQKPELLATGPNQVWSWDITKIKGPKSWIFYDLYVVIDIFSRCIVSWCITEYESGEQARALIGSACARQGIERNQLTDQKPPLNKTLSFHTLEPLRFLRSFAAKNCPIRVHSWLKIFLRTQCAGRQAGCLSYFWESAPFCRTGWGEWDRPGHKVPHVAV
ncbi:MAG: DDE-type integrase/transposase/recombinase [Kiritimatiellales bacterium]|nr:DDE-type integrase/transposase/recombinase [Kiritimatiellota bacterium]MBL7012185.1 DDE-type integrase/transposase/recombinase [Kiritimatiellales bacterium]